MTHRVCSNVGETSTTTGTGALALAGAITGYIRWNAVPSIATSDTTPYMIFSVDGSGNRTTDWEYGIGTYSAANQLTRTTVLGSSNAGAAVTFSAGTKYVFLAALGEKIVNVDANNAVQMPTSTMPGSPIDNTLEMDANCFYGTTDDNNRGYIPIRHMIRADSTRTFTSNTAAQAIFNSPTNGTLTLETGTYLIEGLINIGSMSATSGNVKFDILGAGGATMGSVLYYVVGIDGATATAAAQTGSTSVTSGSPASVVSAATGTAVTMMVRGSFEITVTGTIIPSITMVTGAASVVAIGSYLTFERIGSTSVVSVGQWA